MEKGVSVPFGSVLCCSADSVQENSCTHTQSSSVSAAANNEPQLTVKLIQMQIEMINTEEAPGCERPPSKCK